MFDACIRCSQLGTTVDLELGVCPYCFKKDTILHDDYILRPHDCFESEAREDGHA